MSRKLKTMPHAGGVARFLDGIVDPARRADTQAMIAMMRRISGEEPVLWGPSIVGFGSYHYRYESGHAGDGPRLGFSPRKAALTIYIVPGFAQAGAYLARLGKHTTGKSCLYVKRLADIDESVLEELLAATWAWMRQRYPG